MLLVITALTFAMCAPPTAKCGPKVSRPITAAKAAAFDEAASRGYTLPCVLLARPFDAGNVGSVARGMLNFGLWNMRLVEPIADEKSDEAILRASGAAPILKRAETFGSMADATADLQLVLATTARPRESRIPVHSPREAVSIAAAAISRGERVGLLFGSEKNGLSNDELTYAHGIVTIPTFPGFSSLNLAQAVLLICYEWSTREGGVANDANTDDAAAARAAQAYAMQQPTQLDVARAAAQAAEAEQSNVAAPLKQIDSLFEWWEATLWRVGFFGAGRGVHSAYGESEGLQQEKSRAAAAMAKLRRAIMRAQPSVSEAALLRGALQTMASPKECSRSDGDEEGARSDDTE
jgi:tRNA/rRNA methyltransferase